MKLLFFRNSIVTLLSAVILTSFTTVLCAEVAPVNKQISLGEKIYREGVLSDGSPLKGYVKGDVEIDSTIFSCANCHTRSGLGSIEGQVSSPPINSTTLFNTRYQYKDYLKNVISKQKGVQREAIPLRPAYSDESLAKAIRGGVSPNGKAFTAIMPRYSMEDKEMKLLVEYLRSLSAQFSPGVTEHEMHIATIVGENVPKDDREAMLLPLKRFVSQNRQAASLKKNPKYVKFARMLDESFFRNLRLSVWELKGEPATWQGQLEEYYRKDPPFVLLGGMVDGDWQPIHDFCENKQLPDLFPITDFPVVSETGWYTYYFNKGYFQEGESAARYLASGEGDINSGTVLQITDSSKQALRLSDGFSTAASEKNMYGVKTVNLPEGKEFTGLFLRELLEKEKPSALVLWGGEKIVKLLNDPAINELLPKKIILSSTVIGKRFADMRLNRSDLVYFTYPYRLPQDEAGYKDFTNTFLFAKSKLDDKRIASRTFSMLHVFLLGLKELKLDFYRDTLLDVIGMRQDQFLPDYERFSFGPGQRYASKGCYLVQVDSKSGKLVKKSDWVGF